MATEILGSVGGGRRRSDCNRVRVRKNRDDGAGDTDAGASAARNRQAESKDRGHESYAKRFRRADQTFIGTISPSGRFDATAANAKQMIKDDNYEGEERRHIPYRMQVEPSAGWWSKVTMPFVLALVVQAGGVVWWASKLNTEIDSLREQIGHVSEHMEQTHDYNLERHSSIIQLVRDVRTEIKDNRTLVMDHINNVIVNGE